MAAAELGGAALELGKATPELEISARGGGPPALPATQGARAARGGGRGDELGRREVARTVDAGDGGRQGDDHGRQLWKESCGQRSGRRR
jgi:hypothetical protein